MATTKQLAAIGTKFLSKSTRRHLLGLIKTYTNKRVMEKGGHVYEINLEGDHTMVTTHMPLQILGNSAERDLRKTYINNPEELH